MSDVKTVDVVDATGAKTGSVDLPAEVFGVQTNVPLIHQVVVARLGSRPSGHAQDQDPLRSSRRRSQALPSEGNRQRPSGFDPRSPVQRRWNRARSGAARLLAADAEEDEGRRPARCPLRPRTPRSGLRREEPHHRRRPVDQAGEARARRPLRPEEHPRGARPRRRGHLPQRAQPAPRPRAHLRSAQHLRCADRR